MQPVSQETLWPSSSLALPHGPPPAGLHLLIASHPSHGPSLPEHSIPPSLIPACHVLADAVLEGLVALLEGTCFAAQLLAGPRGLGTLLERLLQSTSARSKCKSFFLMVYLASLIMQSRHTRASMFRWGMYRCWHCVGRACKHARMPQRTSATTHRRHAPRLEHRAVVPVLLDLHASTESRGLLRTCAAHPELSCTYTSQVPRACALAWPC